MQPRELTPEQVTLLSGLVARFRHDIGKQQRGDDQLEAALQRLLARRNSTLRRLVTEVFAKEAP